MAWNDLTGDALHAYRSRAVAPPGLDDFWAVTLAQAREHALVATFEPVSTPLRLVHTYDVTFAGFGGQPVKGWLTLPAGSGSDGERLPAVVEFVGYGGGRSLPTVPSQYALAGFAHLLMDTRGQGSTWSPGHTPDGGADGAPQIPGFMTRGVLDPQTYYYRRLITDAVRAVEAAHTHPAVDPDRVAVTGRSQGGGLAIAAAAFADGVAAAAPDVPFLCDIERATTLTDADPYAELARYCRTHRDQVEQVFATVGHIDGVHLAARATAPAMFGVALMDDICPPSTVYAAYQNWAGPKRIVEYPYNGHEGGEAFHDLAVLTFLHEVFGTETKESQS
jgi:cephalosporin-C deacetylase